MSQPTREQVSLALFNLLTSAYDFATTSRRMQILTDIASANKPALYLDEEFETHSRDKHPVPAVRHINYKVYIFTQADQSIGSDPADVPVTQMNNIFDLIDPLQDGILKPDDTLQNRQTLGGLVYDCYIEGVVNKIPGDLDNQGVITIPIRVIFNR